MFSKIAQTTARAAGRRAFSKTAASSMKVCVVGAAGGIGQPMSLLLKQSPNVTHLALYDVMNTPGVAADLSHIPTKAAITGNLPSVGTWPPSGNDGLKAALTGCDDALFYSPAVSMSTIRAFQAATMQSINRSCITPSKWDFTRLQVQRREATQFAEESFEAAAAAEARIAVELERAQRVCALENA